MNLHRLRCFLMVAEELHFRRAAARLHMSQPPVSMAVKKLEEDLGVKLFDRHNRRVALTPAGLSLQEKGAALMAHAHRVSEEVIRVGQGLAGSLTIGFVGIANGLGLPALVARYHAAFPDVVIALEEMPSNRAAEKLSKGIVDLAFVRGEPDDPLDYVPFVEEKYWVAMPKENSLAEKEQLSLKDLDGQPVLFFPREIHPAIYDAWILAFRQSGVVPRFVQEIRSMNAELGLVAAGVGMALVSQTVTKQPREGMVYRPLEGPCPTVEVNLAWHPDRFHETCAQFIELIH